MNKVNLLEPNLKRFKFTKPIRFISLFSGLGFQELSLKYLEVPFEYHKICEWNWNSFKSFRELHREYNEYDKDLSKEQLVEILYDYGISNDGKDSMKLKSISRKSEEWLRETYNNIKSTNNLVNICNTKGEDLEITNTDNFDYIMFYSYPCQDLSRAGKGKGMAKDSGTRSALLWEVGRLLDETKELPQILVMENVTEANKGINIKEFADWRIKLEKLGYKNYFSNMNAKNYNTPQSRNRLFMISILGDFKYLIPSQIPLTIILPNLLEDEVDEIYYLTDSAKKRISNWNRDKNLLLEAKKVKNISPCLLARSSTEEHGQMILIEHKERLRFLTSKEYLRLMGMKDEDINKLACSDAEKCKQAGNGIVVNVLMAIFKEML